MFPGIPLLRREPTAANANVLTDTPLSTKRSNAVNPPPVPSPLAGEGTGVCRGELARRARLPRSFADGRYDRAGQFSGAAILADRDKGELGFGHLDPLAATLAQHPD